jgi:hypothetical protein
MPRSPGSGLLPSIGAPALICLAVIWVVLCIAAVCIVIWRARRRRP